MRKKPWWNPFGHRPDDEVAISEARAREALRSIEIDVFVGLDPDLVVQNAKHTLKGTKGTWSLV